MFFFNNEQVDAKFVLHSLTDAGLWFLKQNMISKYALSLCRGTGFRT